jgi:hypothetical protein
LLDLTDTLSLIRPTTPRPPSETEDSPPPETEDLPLLPPNASSNIFTTLSNTVRGLLTSTVTDHHDPESDSETPTTATRSGYLAVPAEYDPQDLSQEEEVYLRKILSPDFKVPEDEDHPIHDFLETADDEGMSAFSRIARELKFFSPDETTTTTTTATYTTDLPSDKAPPDDQISTTTKFHNVPLNDDDESEEDITDPAQSITPRTQPQTLNQEQYFTTTDGHLLPEPLFHNLIQHFYGLLNEDYDSLPHFPVKPLTFDLVRYKHLSTNAPIHLTELSLLHEYPLTLFHLDQNGLSLVSQSLHAPPVIVYRGHAHVLSDNAFHPARTHQNNCLLYAINHYYLNSPSPQNLRKTLCARFRRQLPGAPPQLTSDNPQHKAITDPHIAEFVGDDDSELAQELIRTNVTRKRLPHLHTLPDNYLQYQQLSYYCHHFHIPCAIVVGEDMFGLSEDSDHRYTYDGPDNWTLAGRCVTYKKLIDESTILPSFELYTTHWARILSDLQGGLFTSKLIESYYELRRYWAAETVENLKFLKHTFLTVLPNGHINQAVLKAVEAEKSTRLMSCIGNIATFHTRKPNMQEYHFGFDGTELIPIDKDDNGLTYTLHANSTSGWLLVSECTILFQSKQLTLATDNLVLPTHAPLIFAHEGVPGAGKTTAIITNVTVGDIIVTGQRETSIDTRNKLVRRRPEISVIVRTADSQILGKTEKNASTYFDERYACHTGYLLVLASKTLCHTIHTYGDPKQIPPIPEFTAFALPKIITSGT